MQDRPSASIVLPSVSTAGGSAVMALAVLILGAFRQLGWLQRELSLIALAILAACWLVVVAAYTRDAVQGRLFAKHAKDPLKGFGIGTWVAATAQLALAFATLHAAWKGTADVLTAAAGLLLAGYLAVVAIPRLYRFATGKADSAVRRANGSLLLGCVAVQAVAIAGQAAFGRPFRLVFASWLWPLGIALYVLGVVVIVRAYARRTSRLADEWRTPNTILHGGVSITGLAAAVNGLLPFSALLWLWMLAFLIFAAVESFELARLARRFAAKRQVKMSYSSEQWSRNFTFGMLLLYTMQLHKLGVQGPHAVMTIQHAVLHVGPYVVIVVFVLEAAVWLVHGRFRGFRKTGQPSIEHA